MARSTCKASTFTNKTSVEQSTIFCVAPGTQLIGVLRNQKGNLCIVLLFCLVY
jgi:hypothetical protein